MLCPLIGALQGIRTPDLLVRSQTLYPAELAAHILLSSGFRLTAQVYYHICEKKSTLILKKIQFFQNS